MSDVIAVLGLVVAGLGVVVGPLIARRQATDRNEHEREMARDERRQRRLEALYTETADYVLRVAAFLARTYPVFELPDAPGPPAFPSDDELRNLSGRIGIFGTAVVQDLLTRLFEEGQAFQGQAYLLQGLLERGGSLLDENGVPVRESIHEKRQVAMATVDEVLARMNAELTA